MLLAYMLHNTSKQQKVGGLFPFIYDVYLQKICFCTFNYNEYFKLKIE